MREPATKLLERLIALLDALRNGACDQQQLLEKLWASQAYKSSEHATRMLNRDISYLARLGITIERTNTRPPIYTLRGGLPIYTYNDLRVLALIRDSFDTDHPQYPSIQALLQRLTHDLTVREQQTYAKRTPLRVPIRPAIDYTPYESLIATLEDAITGHHLLQFSYRSSRGHTRLHKRVEPLEIEYYDRHFYLVAYLYTMQQVIDFRIDRIRTDDTFQVGAAVPPHLRHERSYITFRYRLAANLAQGEISQRFHQQTIVEVLPNGDVIIEAQGRSSFFIRRTLLKYAANAELLSPDWLRAELANEIRALGELYE